MSKPKKPGGGGGAPPAAAELFGYLPRLPFNKVAEYRGLECALRNLRERLERLAYADVAAPLQEGDAEGNGFEPSAGQDTLAGDLMTFWYALYDAAGAESANRKLMRDTAGNLRDHIPHAHHAQELLRAGVLDNLPDAAPEDERRRLVARWVRHSVRYWGHFEDEAVAWHRVKLHIGQYADALLSALRPTDLDAGPNGAEKPTPPLTSHEQKVLDLIMALPDGKGITGRQILNALVKQGRILEQGTLTRHIIPKLKEWFGVENAGGARGYFIPRK